MKHPNPTQRCRKCQRELPRDAFDPYVTKEGKTRGIHLRCRICQGAIRPPAMRRCIRCDATKPIAAFDPMYAPNGERNGLYARCRACRNEIAQSRRPTKQFPRHLSLIDRVFSRISITPGCWIWQGSRTGRKPGYGRIIYQGKRMGVHVVVFEHYHGPLLPGQVVRHRCDNPPCCNPDHLLSGTQGQNVQDSIERGRHWVPQGATQHNAKLTDEQVREMRELRAAGMTLTPLARRFRVHKSTVGRIVQRKAWRHVA